MYLLSLLEPQTVQDWIAVGIAAATAIVLISKKLRSIWLRK